MEGEMKQRETEEFIIWGALFIIALILLGTGSLENRCEVYEKSLFILISGWLGTVTAHLILLWASNCETENVSKKNEEEDEEEKDE